MGANLPSKDVIAANIRGRIQAMTATYGGLMPERAAIAWHAYLVGLREWGVLTLPVYKNLADLLPPVADDPSESLLKEQ